MREEKGEHIPLGAFHTASKKDWGVLFHVATGTGEKTVTQPSHGDVGGTKKPYPPTSR